MNRIISDNDLTALVTSRLRAIGVDSSYFEDILALTMTYLLPALEKETFESNENSTVNTTIDFAIKSAKKKYFQQKEDVRIPHDLHTTRRLIKTVEDTFFPHAFGEHREWAEQLLTGVKSLEEFTMISPRERTKLEYLLESFHKQSRNSTPVKRFKFVSETNVNHVWHFDEFIGRDSDILENLELRDLYSKLVRTLSSHQKKILLRYLSGDSQKQIAEDYGVSPQATGSVLDTIRRRARKFAEGKNDNEQRK